MTTPETDTSVDHGGTAQGGTQVSDTHDKTLELVVTMEDVGAAANIGGAVQYRTVHVPLTEQQQDLIRGRNTWESAGHVHIQAVEEVSE